MKKLLTFIGVASLALTIQAQNITNTLGDGGNFVIASPSNNGGMLIPTLTEGQRDAIVTPALTEGLMIYQTDNTKGFYYYDGSAWVAVSSPGATDINGLSDAYRDNDTYFIGHEPNGYPSGTNENTVFGYGALGWMNSGNDNIAIGYAAGGLFNGGSHNIMIGNTASLSADAANNELNIGDAIYATGLYGSSAKVGIGNGNNAPAATLDVSGDVKVSTSINIGTIIHLTPGSAPSSPSEGDIYVNSSDHHIYFYNGTSWKQMDN